MASDSEANPYQPDPAVPTPQPRRRRFQFSLATLLWLTTLVACLAALGAMYRELRQASNELRSARDEIQKYRGELGYFDVTDRTKIYVRAMRTAGEFNWSWRYYVPEKPNCRLCTACRGIPEKGFPVPGDSWYPDPGEHLLDLSCEPATDGQWCILARHDSGLGASSTGKVLPINGQFHESGILFGSPSANKEQAFECSTRVVLLRIRNCTSGGNIDPNPCDGLMVWIEEDK